MFWSAMPTAHPAAMCSVTDRDVLSGGGEPTAAGLAAAGWQKVHDPTDGVTYFHHAASGHGVTLRRREGGSGEATMQEAAQATSQETAEARGVATAMA